MQQTGCRLSCRSSGLRAGEGQSVCAGRCRRSQTRRLPVCEAANELVTLGAGISPSLMQDILVGGAVVGAVGFTLVAGLKKEQVICDLCLGTGGSRCFACAGDGKMTNLISKEALLDGSTKRDTLGRSPNGRECRVCKGAGLIACSKCRGSGYMNA